MSFEKSFECFAEITRMNHGYNTIQNMILAQYQNLVEQNYQPSSISTNPAAEKQRIIAEAVNSAEIILASRSKDYVELVKSVWEKKMPEAEFVDMVEGLKVPSVRKYFENNISMEGTMREVLGPFTQSLFQSIMQAPKAA